MTEQEKQEIKTQLIQLGFWGEDERGDPLTNAAHAARLRSRIAERLSCMLAVTSGVNAVITDLSPRRVSAVCKGSEKTIADGATYAEAGCLAALALPQFVKENPECAARQLSAIEKGSRRPRGQNKR
jgi:hypothetical protein